VSNPFFISTLSAIIGAVVGGLFTWIVFIRQINWEVATKHFEDLKRNVIEPWIDDRVYATDGPLFQDLINEHYPELQTLQDEYVKAKEKERKEEQALEQEINETLESLLKNANIAFQKKYGSVQDVCFSGHLAEYIKGILENSKWYANLIVPASKSPSTSSFYVKIDGTDVFMTSDEAKAQEVRDKLEKVVKAVVVDSKSHEKMKGVRQAREGTLEKVSALTCALKEINMKSKLRLRKKFKIFPRPCKYLKS
jgi:hypothetical protein